MKPWSGVALERNVSLTNGHQRSNRPETDADAGFGAEGAGMLRDIWAALEQPAQLLSHARAVGHYCHRFDCNQKSMVCHAIRNKEPEMTESCEW
jgi:hypothetical protein